MEELIRNIQSSSSEEFTDHLDSFCQRQSKTKSFPELNSNNLRSQFWDELFKKLENEENPKVHEKCLAAMRILSRDKTELNFLMTNDRINIIIRRSNLSDLTPPTNVNLEAIKLLCNLIYNSEKVQSEILNTCCLPDVLKRLSNCKDYFLSEATLFEVRIVFLITALNIQSRSKVKEMDGDEGLISMLETLTNQLDQKDLKFQEKAVEILNELLKTLFNLYLNTEDSEEDKKKHKKLTQSLFILLTSKNTQNREELHSHVANLLTVVPFSCCQFIIQPVKLFKSFKAKGIYENMDMSAVDVLLYLLDKKLSENSNLESTICQPVLVALLNLSKSVRLVRKYLRQVVLPPLRDDVMTRPEEGSTLKAKLCQKLTSPITGLKDLVAEFLFVLCKENVGRMIKYTGYGNAAGMFANKGLLGCRQPETEYSSESGESDTEEYAKYKKDINPVTACYEKPKQCPFENMTEEQIEYEAMKLVNIINELTNSDAIIKPCTIGEDGKPKPIEHVLELQEGLKRSQINQSDSE